VHLTDVQIRGFKSQPGKSVKFFGGRGLYLEVTGAGSRWWRLKYRFAGKEKQLSLGVYPETSLKEARDPCEETRKLLIAGVDPSQQRQVDKLASTERAENTFEKVGREWFAKRAEIGDPAHAGRILSRLERDIFPLIGVRSNPIGSSPGYGWGYLLQAPLFEFGELILLFAKLSKRSQQLLILTFNFVEGIDSSA
jgi:hypothetical protein